MENGNNGGSDGRRGRAYSKIEAPKGQSGNESAGSSRPDGGGGRAEPARHVRRGTAAPAETKQQPGKGHGAPADAEVKRGRGRPPAEERPPLQATEIRERRRQLAEQKQQAERAQAARRGARDIRRRELPAVKIIPLGGLEEIGKNMTLFECGGDMIIVDCGMGFPDYELFGIDIVIPDFSFAVENKDKIKALLITHGHEDHIGAIPYFLKEMNLPIYGTKLTIGLIEAKLREHGIEGAQLHEISHGKKLRFGCFDIEPVRVNHSIPDAVAFAIGTPAGLIVHTGDFKVDFTPVLDDVIDLRRFGELGGDGVMLMMADSTNAERTGASLSERVVGESFEALVSRAAGKRLVIASFASNLQRVQQIIRLAERHGRKVAISGRSMENYTEMALKLGYLKVESPEIFIGINDVSRYRPEDVIIITTGSQGEPMSALSRMANGTHKQITISANDFVIISASPIPGNEKTITRVINELMKLGSEVIYESMYEVHASGHACRDDLKLMFSMLKPKYFIPVHGEYRHLVRNREIALAMGVERQNALLPAIGQAIVVSRDGIRYGETVKSGRVLVDGLGVGDVGTSVLRDRKHLSEEGLMVVLVSLNSETNELLSEPDIISKGFVFQRDADELIVETKALICDIVERFGDGRDGKERGGVKLAIRDEVGRLMYQRTRRSPMILPVVVEI